MPFSFSFKLSAASAGAWVAREASSEIIPAELPKRRRERLHTSWAVAAARQVSSGEMSQTQMKLSPGIYR